MIPSTNHWLKELGLSEYADAFAENAVDFALLRHLTNEDLKDLGIAKLGDRKKLLLAIEQLNSAPDTQPDGPGAAAGDVPTNATSRPVSSDAERRQLTIMFCDMVGSTALSQQLDPERLRDVVRFYQDAVSGAVTRYGGHIAKYLGDGVLAYFGWPQAYEDQAERAVRSGLETVAAVATIVADDERTLAARVGIETGEVVVGDLIGDESRDDKAVSGETPNLAARLQEIGEPGQVIIGATTGRLVGNIFDIETLGPTPLKGFADPVPVFRVTGERPAESRFETMRGGALVPLVGREHELALIVERWAMAKKQEGQIVELSGAAGIGKSRIVRSLLDHIAEEPHFRQLYQCSPYHTNSAYFPIVRRLERAAGFTSSDTPDGKLEKLEKLLAISGQDVTDIAPWFADLLSLPIEERYGNFDLTPQQRRERIAGTLIDQALALSKIRPVLLVFEDTHWIDPTTREFLDLISAAISDQAIMMIMTHRPDESPAAVSLPHLSTIALNRLSREEGRQIIRAAGGDEFSNDVIDQIAARGDGIPLYVEELTRSVAEAGGKSGVADIPDSLQASLVARLDRLGDAKEIVQIGSVIGREFSQNLLSALNLRSEIETSEALEKIVKSELIYRRGMPPDTTFVFKHALVHDAAYNSLLKRRRQEFHLQVAEELEAKYPDIVQTQPELLAHHFAEAKQEDRSVQYWFRAGQQAIERSANPEAIAHLTKGKASLLKRSASLERDEEELDFCLALGPPIMSMKGFACSEAREVYHRATELCCLFDDLSKSYSATWGLWIVNQQGGHIDNARALIDEIFELAGRRGVSSDYMLQAHHAAWTTELFVGKITESQQHTVDGLSIYDFDQHRAHAFVYGGHDPGVCAHTTASESLCLMGYVDQAVDRAHAAIELAEKLNHPYTLAMARYFLAQVHQHRRESPLVATYAQEAMAVCEEHGFESFRAQSSMLLGWAIAVNGDTEAGTERLLTALADWQATGTGMRLSFYYSLLAESLYRANKPREGLGYISKAESVIEGSGERRWEAETRRLKADLLNQANGNPEDIETAYLEAYEIAKSQQAKLLELRAVTSIGGWYIGKNRSEEVKGVISPVVNWFTEGYDTPDMADARGRLLDMEK